MFVYFTDVTAAAGPFSTPRARTRSATRRELPERDEKARRTDEQLAADRARERLGALRGDPRNRRLRGHLRLPQAAEAGRAASGCCSSRTTCPASRTCRAPLELTGIDDSKLSDDQFVAVHDRPRLASRDPAAQASGVNRPASSSERAPYSRRSAGVRPPAAAARRGGRPTSSAADEEAVAAVLDQVLCAHRTPRSRQSASPGRGLVQHHPPGLGARRQDEDVGVAVVRDGSSRLYRALEADGRARQAASRAPRRPPPRRARVRPARRGTPRAACQAPSRGRAARRRGTCSRLRSARSTAACSKIEASTAFGAVSSGSTPSERAYSAAAVPGT